MIIPSDILQEVKILLSQNKKVHAVALVKRATNCSLKEAKDYVDQLDQPKVTFTGNIDDQLRVLLLSGNKIEAIKVYRDHSGASLAESKEYVENLDQYAGRKNTGIDGLFQEQAKPGINYSWLIILLIAAAVIAWALLR
jgi:ribosomal protein L7/L12